jgi:hypothetical protein
VRKQISQKAVALVAAIRRLTVSPLNADVSTFTGKPVFGNALLVRINNVKNPDEAYRLCDECISAGLLNIAAISALCPYVIELAQLTRSGQADGPRMWHCLGLIAISCDDHKAARKLIERAISADPSDADMRNSLGISLLRAGNANMACCTFSQAALMRPQSEAIRANLEASRHSLRANIVGRLKYSS